MDGVHIPPIGSREFPVTKVKKFRRWVALNSLIISIRYWKGMLQRTLDTTLQRSFLDIVCQTRALTEQEYLWTEYPCAAVMAPKSTTRI